MKNIKKVVENCIKLYKTNDPFEIAEKKNIYVFVERLGDLNGYYNVSNRIKYIHVNSALSQREQKLVCAHELGHAFLHGSINTSILTKYTYISKNTYENEANLFAVELLLPDKYFSEYMYMEYSLEQIAKNEHLPIELIKLKVMKYK